VSWKPSMMWKSVTSVNRNARPGSRSISPVTETGNLDPSGGSALAPLGGLARRRHPEWTLGATPRSGGVKASPSLWATLRPATRGWRPPGERVQNPPSRARPALTRPLGGYPSDHENWSSDRRGSQRGRHARYGGPQGTRPAALVGPSRTARAGPPLAGRSEVQSVPPQPARPTRKLDSCSR
jgi:hypothetical protein